MKKKCTAVIGMVLCFMMMATGAWAGIPGVPNGTVTDGNLVWLLNADCLGKRGWFQAMESAASLKSGSCGLTDGSTAGQWRLPTREELRNRQKNKSGFNNVQSSQYLSSTKYGLDIWLVDMSNGNMYHHFVKTGDGYVWPVRGVQ